MLFEADYWVWHAIWISITGFFFFIFLSFFLEKVPVIGPYFVANNKKVEEEGKEISPQIELPKNIVLEGLPHFIMLLALISPLYLFGAITINGEHVFVVTDKDNEVSGREEMLYYGDDELFGLPILLGSTVFDRIKPGEIKFADDYKKFTKPFYNKTKGTLYVTRHGYGSVGNNPTKDLGTFEPGETKTVYYNGILRVGCESKLPEKISIPTGGLRIGYVTRITEKPDALCQG